MLKFLLIILLVAIYVAIGYWLIVKKGFDTAREFAQYLMNDANDDFAYQLEAIRNRYGEQGIRVFTVLYSIILVLLVPICTAWFAIKYLFEK